MRQTGALEAGSRQGELLDLAAALEVAETIKSLRTRLPLATLDGDLAHTARAAGAALVVAA